MARMKTWSTDVGHLAPMDDLTMPLAARRRSAFTRELVEAATSRRAAESWCSAVRCIARVGRRVCGERIHVEQPKPGQVAWSCAACGEAGVVTGFAGTEFDMSAYVPGTKKVRIWGFDDESREVLLARTTQLPSLRAVLARASPSAEIPGLLVLQATVDELDEIYTLVEHLTDATRSRRRIELLDDLRAGLCSAMDGF
jgi:hypothetical protein